MRKSVFFYFKKSIAFFDLKARSIPPAVFIGMLALYSLYFYIMQTDAGGAVMQDAVMRDAVTQGAASAQDAYAQGAAYAEESFVAMVAGFVIMLLCNMLSYIYLDAAIREAKQEEYAARQCVASAVKHILRLTVLAILKNIILFAGLLMLIIPGLIFSIILLFSECAVLDKGSKAVEGMRFSGKITKGARVDIFKIKLFCDLILAFFVILLLNIFSSNNLFVFQYIMLFTLSICVLVEHKLVAFLYADALAAYEGRAPGPEGADAGA